MRSKIHSGYAYDDKLISHKLRLAKKVLATNLERPGEAVPAEYALLVSEAARHRVTLREAAQRMLLEADATAHLLADTEQMRDALTFKINEANSGDELTKIGKSILEMGKVQ